MVGASRGRVISRSLAPRGLMLTPACKLVSAAEQPAINLLQILISMIRGSRLSETQGETLTPRYKPGQCMYVEDTWAWGF